MIIHELFYSTLISAAPIECEVHVMLYEHTCLHSNAGVVLYISDA